MTKDHRPISRSAHEHRDGAWVSVPPAHRDTHPARRGMHWVLVAVIVAPVVLGVALLAVRFFSHP